MGYWFDNPNGPVPSNATPRPTLAEARGRREAQLLAERIAAAEAVIDRVALWRRSWCSREEQQLRDRLPELAARMSEDELVSHVTDALTAASEKNRKARHGY